MRLYTDRDHEVAVRAAVEASAALSAHAEGLAVVDARREFDRDLVTAADLALALAARAGRADNLAGAAAIRAGSGGLHGHAHEALLRADAAGALTARAGVCARAGRGAGAAALVAVFDARGRDLLFRAEGGLLKGDLNASADILAACGRIGAAARRAASAAEEAAKQVAQISEVPEAARTAAEGVARVRVKVGVYTREAELVVTRTLFGVGQNLVGLVNLLEALDGIRLVVHVRMVFCSQLTVGFFNIGLGRVLADA